MWVGVQCVMGTNPMNSGEKKGREKGKKVRRKKMGTESSTEENASAKKT